jgi:2-Cys peroxiredoxin 5
VRLLADTGCAMTKALDLELDLSAVLGSVRCKRFSLLCENGIITKLNVEPDGTGMTCSLADKILD